MAKMIPDCISKDVISTGEKQIFELFKKAPDTENWIVLHSLYLSKHVKRLYGEIDFLVMAPGLGIFCLEVKGGEIARKDGLWKHTNRYGEVFTKSRSPFEQSRDCMFSLKKAINNKCGANSKLNNLLYGYGVMFPHSEFYEEGIDYELYQIYNRNSRRQPVTEFIKTLAACTKQAVKNEPWFCEKTSIPDEKDIKDLLAFCRGDFERILPPDQRMGEAEGLIMKYTEEQYKYLDQLQYNPRCFFQGAAGTGKTMLALEAAKRSIFAKNRTLLVCYNILLGNWLKFLLNDVTEDNDNLVAGNFHGFLTDIVTSRGPIPSCITEDKYEYYNVTLPLMALEAIDRGEIEPFDKIIIDEGQDLMTPEYLDVFDSLLKGGLAGGKWDIYSDLEQQAIFSRYSVEDMRKMLEKRCNSANFRLNINCRNTKQIGEATSLMTGFPKPPFILNEIDGIPVEYKFYRNREHQIKELEELLEKLRNQHIPDNKITILSKFKFENSCISGLDTESFPVEIFSSKHNAIPLLQNCKHISFSTISSFKGLENSYIILIDVHKLNEEDYNSLLYVGMSRARTGLYVFINKKYQEEHNKLLGKTK